MQKKVLKLIITDNYLGADMKKKMHIQRKRGQLIRRKKETALQKKERERVVTKLTAKNAKTAAEERKKIRALFEEGINSKYKPTRSFFRRLRLLADKGMLVREFE